ncbi:hypothetical protein B0O99DRAFT_736732 [Bisporella sp. PMI_857]|nr:hypothetical protein B0O99DRAFT_736732 [Bisporella sp. PMI_857]
MGFKTYVHPVLWTFFFSFITFGQEIKLNKNGVAFLFPTEGLELNYLDTVNVSYISPFESPLLYTFCLRPNQATILTKIVERVHPFNSSALVLLNWTDVDDCYFNLRPNTSTGFGANSPHIKVVQGGASRGGATFSLTPIVLPSSTTSPASSSDSGVVSKSSLAPSSLGVSSTSNAGTATQGSSRSTSNTGASQTSTPSANLATASTDPSSVETAKSVSKSAEKSGLSTGVKATIGVVISMIAIAIISVIILLVRRRQRGGSGQKLPIEDENVDPIANQVQPSTAGHYEKPKSPPQELFSDVRYELDNRSDVLELDSTPMAAVGGYYELDSKPHRIH